MENAATAFFPENKNSQRKRSDSTTEEPIGRSGFELPVKNNNTSYKHMRACVPAEPGTLRTVILSNNVFSSVAASWVARLALWPGTALKTTIMIVTSRCLGTASASPDGG